MNFDWRDRSGPGLISEFPQLVARFSGDMLGFRIWNELFQELDFPSDEWRNRVRYLLLSDESEFLRLSPDDKPQPTVFVSHRSTDVRHAERAANRLRSRGIDVWLDVEDPILASLGSAHGLADEDVALLTALIIEFALVNSSHVLALMTKKTEGSMWVPYEYGRIKRAPIFAQEAGSWHKDASVVPEYTYLGKQIYSIVELDQWP